MNGIRNTSLPPQSDDFAKYLRELRRQRGLSIAALAHLVHYSRGHLNNIEHGVKTPSSDLAAACDEALGACGQLKALIPRQTRNQQKPTLTVRPAQLPAAAGRFIGREQELRALDDLVQETGMLPVAVVHGPPGVGKTTLALRWGHLHRDSFPDGQLFADLRGHSADGEPASPDEVLEEFLVSLGLPPSEVPATTDERAALFRSMMAGRRMLVMLDSAASSAQVRLLLPGSPGSAVIVTTRTMLSGLAVRYGASQVRVPPFEPDDAMNLLRAAVGSERVDAEAEAAHNVLAHCGRLPLAVALVAERLAAHPLTLTDLETELTEERQRLTALTADDEDTNVRAVFSWSYRALPAEAARMFRLLGLHPGRHISVSAAAELTETSTAEARNLLRVLAGSHLIEESTRQRFFFHDLLRVYAIERARSEEQKTTRDDARRRELIWYTQTAEEADRLLAPYNHENQSGQTGVFRTYEEALDWCEIELPNFTAVVSLAVHTGQPEAAWNLPRALFSFFHLRKPWSTWDATYQLGLHAARQEGNPHAEADMLQGLGLVRLGLHEFDEALAHFQTSLDILDQQQDSSGEAWSVVGIGLAHAGRGSFDVARPFLEQGLAIQRASDDRHGEAVTLIHLAGTCREVNQPENARAYAQRALEIFRETGDRYGEGLALQQIGTAYAAAKQFSEAVRFLRQALQVQQTARDSKGEADTLWFLGRALLSTGDTLSAREHLQQAEKIFGRRGDPASVEVRAQLAYLDELPKISDQGDS